MKNVAKHHRKRKYFYWLSLGLILFSCFSNVDLIFENNYDPNFNESIVMHSSNKPNYPSGISHIVIDNNWTETEAMFDWCNGSGSWDDPYIIHDILLDCEEKGSGILVNNSQSSYFVIQNCTFYNCSNFAGIKIENSVNAQLFDNNLSYYNQFGIELVNVDNSSLFSNDLINNNIGILIQDTNKSIFYDNNIFDNSIVGVNITSVTSETNTFYNNNFSNNGINAYDAGTDSEWDIGVIGNFWDDYGGADLDDNGFGDDPYLVDGPANAQDNYPIWNDGDDLPPILTVISPLNNTIWSTAPQINVSAYDINLDSIWYSVGGFGQIEELQNETAEYLLSIIWNGLPEGKFNITFQANDTLANIDDPTVLDLYKDTKAPFINIITPTNHTYWNTRPTIQVSVSDTYFQSVWYEIDGQKEGLENGVPEVLNLSIWESITDETDFIIQFFANDSVGNVNDSYSLNLYKDLSAPTLTVNLPADGTYWNTLHNVQATATDTNFDAVWYVVDGTKILLDNAVAKLFNQSIWDGLMDEETFTIYFYANDSAGNVNSLHSRTIHKDITDPTLTINLPVDGTYWNTRPNVQATAADTNFDAVWYVVDGTKILLDNGVAKLFNQSIWDGLMDEETFTIYFYANDSAGNINSLHSRTIYKDIKNPVITVNDPSEFDVFGLVEPPCSVDFYDLNGIDQSWYQLTNGSLTTIIRQWNGSINAFDWDLMANGTVSLLLYANDSLGNIGFLSFTVYKDIISPSIIINSPEQYDLFGIDAPNVDLTIYDPHLETVWYELYNGTDFTGIILWTGTIDGATWDIMGNGTVTIRFTAVDSVFNIAYNNVIVRKTIHDPVITILHPDDGALVGELPPVLVLYNASASIDSIWYYLSNGSIITDNTNWTGSIDESLWNLFGDGDIYLYFYINDTLGNLGSDIIFFEKDVTAPSITIDSPDPFELFGTTPPDANVQFNELNIIDQTWYQLYSSVTTTPMRNWGGIINQNDWDLMPNGTITIIFFANDSVGNLRSVNVSVYRDILEPTVNIFNPGEGDLYGTIAPLIYFSADDPNGISYITYQLSNGTLTTPLLEWSSSIDQALWAQFGNGTVTVYVFASDTLGNEGFDSLFLRKDIVAPSINIQLPLNYQEVGRDSPFFEVYMTDANIDTTWYRIMGTSIDFTFTGIYGKIDQNTWENLWDTLAENDSIIIRFYGNDTTGNLDYEELILLKPISTNDLPPPTFPFDLMQIIPLSIVIGSTAVLSVAIRKSRFYSGSDEKHKKFLNRMLILTALLVSLITAAVLTQSL